MSPKPSPNYLAGYPPSLTDQVLQLIDQGHLAERYLKKYPTAHGIRNDRALYDYVQSLKNEFLRNAGQLSKIAFDSKLHVIQHALGTHTRISRIQGSKLKAKKEIRIATIFRDMPAEFLRMIVVHELAHMKEAEHGKAFYQLCVHMEPDYHQLEFELRAYLCYLENSGRPLWAASTDSL